MKFSIQLERSYKPTNEKWPQYLAVVTASLMSFSMGLHFAWPSPYLPILLSNKSQLNVTTEEASYVVLIAPLGNIIGAPLAAILADMIGRKIGIIFTSIPLFVAWMFIAFAGNILVLCIGRFISGIAEGFLFILSPMYVGEVTEPDIRGVLGCSMSVMNIIGMLAINAYGPYLSIQTSAILSSVFPLISVTMFIYMPESPYFLLMKGKTKEARSSLIFLRRCDVSKELEVLQNDITRQMSEAGSFKDMFCVKCNRKSLIIIMGIRTVQQMSGISALALFTQTIFLQAEDELSPILSSIIYLTTQLIMTSCGSILVDKYGRKPLLIYSGVATGVILNIGGIYFFFKEMTNYDISAISWLPLLVMICYVIVYSIGLGTVPSLMLGELFSAKIKGKALCMMCIYYSILISLMSKLFSFLMESYGIYASFLFFGNISLLSVFFSYYVVPETKNKSLEEIQQYLKGNCDNNMTKT